MSTMTASASHGSASHASPVAPDADRSAPEAASAPVASASPGPRSAALATRYALLGWILVSAVHYFIVSAGGVWPLPSYSAYTNRQADAFARGQAALILRPAPALLALPDPYDPEANRPYRRGVGVHDTVLYDGKLYLYWGPVPALILTAFKPLLGGHRIVGDEWLVLAFTLGANLAGTLLLRRLWRRCFPDRSPAVVLLGLLLLGLAAPTTYFLARSAVYEVAIAGGQCFLLFGLLFAWRACDRPRCDPQAAHPLAGLATAALAGLCLALAVGCRASLAVAVVGVALVVVGAMTFQGRWRWSGRRQLPADPRVAAEPGPPVPSVAARLIAFGLPLLVGAAALAGYNQARFGSPLEFGQRYQLTGANYRALPALFSPANAVPGLWSYLARPLAARPQFPFVRPIVGEGTFPRWVTLPPHYETHETIAGLAITAPTFLLAMVPLAALLAPRRRLPPGARLVVGLLALAGGLGFAPVLFMVGSTQRYLMDLWPCCAILAAVGAWMLSPPGGRPRLVVRATARVLVLWTLGMGVLLGFTGYYDHFHTWNHSLYQSLGGD